MNRIPVLIFIVIMVGLAIKYFPRIIPGSEKLFRRIVLPCYGLVILYLTIFSRVFSPRKLFERIFNLGRTAIDPTEQVVVGNRGSEWLAGRQGVSGFRLFLIGLSDPNSKLYIIPSCLMNLLLFVPLGMLFGLTPLYQDGWKSDETKDSQPRMMSGEMLDSQQRMLSGNIKDSQSEIIFEDPVSSAAGKRRKWIWILVCAICVLGIECIQHIFQLGQFDLLDVVFNTAGFALGLFVYEHLINR